MSQKNNEYYTANEAMKVLGKAKSTFYREVEAGIIPAIGGKRNRKFPKEAVHLHLLHERKKRYGTMRLTFSPSTNADLWTAIEHEQQKNRESFTYRRALDCCFPWMRTLAKLCLKGDWKQGKYQIG